MKRNDLQRAEVVKAMDLLARCINDESQFMGWLCVGVADGDIDDNTTPQEIVDMGYTDDGTFKDLMSAFIRYIHYAYEDGGIYCNGIVSKDKIDY